jgi:hypothetical protein
MTEVECGRFWLDTFGDPEPGNPSWDAYYALLLGKPLTDQCAIDDAIEGVERTGEGLDPWSDPQTARAIEDTAGYLRAWKDAIVFGKGEK